jgi:acyl-CoA synthetase (AMP-forming)/AMP-acid ligase II
MLQQSVADQLLINAVAFPERPAIEVVDGPAATYGEAWRRTVALADALRDVPERDGRRMVATLLPNGIDAALAYVACQLAGCTAVPVNNRFAAAEIEYVLDDSGAVTVLTSEPYLDAVAALRPRTPPAVIDAEQIATPAVVGDVEIRVDPEAPMLVGYTSGTTGFPKGALYSHETMYLHYVRWGWQFELSGRQTLLTAGPMFHNSYGGLSLLSLMTGSTNRVLAAWDPAVAYRELAERATWAMLVPAMLTVVLERWDAEGRPPLPSLRFLLSSAAPISAELLAAAIAAFPSAKITEAYGWSEGGWVTYEVKTPETLTAQCVGWPVPGADIRILREDRTRCDVGERGEIAVRNVTPFTGYLNKPRETAEAQHGEYVLSGDLGMRGDDGRIYLLDRKKDMIISGGENVYSVEIERVLAAHPGVLEVAVIGRPDPRWGEAVTAVVAVEPGGPDEAELREHCRGQLAGYKVPKRVEFVDALPRNSMGKVQKFVLRDQPVPSPAGS